MSAHSLKTKLLKYLVLNIDQNSIDFFKGNPVILKK